VKQREPVPLGAPDTYALRRRVLLTAGIVVPLYFAAAFFITWLDVSDAWLLVAIALIYLLVARPLMQPVREAIKLRRRLAYESWAAEKARAEDTDPPP
jgi:small-conductance mechanosensitive channel